MSTSSEQAGQAVADALHVEIVRERLRELLAWLLAIPPTGGIKTVKGGGHHGGKTLP